MSLTATFVSFKFNRELNACATCVFTDVLCNQCVQPVTMDTHCAVISQMLYNSQSVHSFHGNIHNVHDLDMYDEIIYLVAPQSARLTPHTDRVNQVDCAHP